MPTVLGRAFLFEVWVTEFDNSQFWADFTVHAQGYTEAVQVLNSLGYTKINFKGEREN
jgi:hypothetical protein